MSARKDLEEIFHAARAVPPGAQRDALVAARCSEDGELARKLADLLVADAAEDGFLASSEGPLEAPASIGPGDMVGRYRLLRRLGAGGDGEVFLCRLDGTDLPEAALKLLAVRQGKRAFLERFDLERRALALMDHPGIARLIDAGIADHERAFLVMERVDGEPLTAYADRRRLSVRERLGLLREVALAVAHAHDRGVIHRDLKPANVLVAHIDGRPVPKVLDFGIAHAVELGTAGFGDGAFVGTPEYMAPEQAGGALDDVGEKADVYALGALLFELLTGTTPRRSESVRGLGIEALREAVRAPHDVSLEERLSACEARARIANLRSTDEAGLARFCSNDLEGLVARALASNPEGRLPDVRAFVSELERILRSLDPAMSFQESRMRAVDPVSLGVSIRREVLTALATGLERDGADEGERLTELTRLEETLRRVNFTTVARHVTAETVLGREQGDLEPGCDDAPLVRAALLQAQADVLLTQELYERAGPIIQQAVDLRTEHLGEDAPETLVSMHSLGSYLRRTGRTAEARPLYDRVVAGWRRAVGDEDRRTLEARMNLGLLLMNSGDWLDAEEHLRAIVELGHESLGEKSESWLRALINLGAVHEQLGRTAEAASSYRGAWEGLRETCGPEHVETLTARGNLGRVLSALGEHEEAVDLLSGAVKGARRLLGDDHLRTLLILLSHGEVLREAGQSTEALQPMREAAEGLRTLLGAEHEYAIVSAADLALTLSVSGDDEAALKCAGAAVARANEHLSEAHPQRAGILLKYGRCLGRAGRTGEALAAIEEARAALVKVFGTGHAVLAEVAVAREEAERASLEEGSP
jgi:eukaryotic-like serine/threonine-protein kinase